MNYFQRLQSSIEYIENNLSEEITLIDVARESNCSLFHFHRLFQVIVGNSVKEYIRNRRLTLAAKDLVETDTPVIDIAFDYQYGAPESFTRAFKKMYGLSPTEYRKWGAFAPLTEKANLLKVYYEELKKGIKMKPIIKVKKEFKVIGIELSTQHSSCQKDVPKFWKEISQEKSFQKIEGLKNPSEIYGICYGTCNGKCNDSAFSKNADDSDEFGYLICSEIDNFNNIPEGFVTRTMSKGKYAAFTIKGGFLEIQKGIETIYKNWLSNTSYELAHSPHFEKYDDRWTGKEDSEMEIWIPIK